MAFNTVYTDEMLVQLGRAVEVAQKKPTPKPQKTRTYDRKALQEYADLAAEIGLIAHDLQIEEFKIFLNENDIPVFNLQEVISYMDDKAAEESKEKAGWEWCPLRNQDHREGISFGTKAERHWVSNEYTASTPASDYYQSEVKRQVWQGNVNSGVFAGTSSIMAAAQLQQAQYQQANQGQYLDHTYPSPNRVYDYAIPMHALKKVALITKHFGDKVGLFVSDYALAPAIQYPDPFLMAVIANPRVDRGEGRFVIDFWNEPNFGLASQLR